MKTGTKILGLVGGAVLLILMQDNLWMIVMVMVGAAVLTGLGAGLRELHRQDEADRRLLAEIEADMDADGRRIPGDFGGDFD